MTGPSLSAVYKTQSERRLPDLERSVRQMVDQPGDVIEIVVLTDNPAVYDQLDDFESIDRLIRVEDSRLTSARNTGAEAATGDAVAFVDDDAYPGADWADRIRNALREYDAAGGPLHPDWRTDEPGWLPEAFYWLIGCGPFYDSPRLVANTYGSNFVVDREAFLDVGGFDTAIGAGSDSVQQGAETDLARRLREAGYRALWYSPDAVMYHAVEPANIRRAALLRRAYGQGVAKAHIGFDDRESSYLRDEWSLGDGPRQAVTSLALTGAVGAGFLRGRVRVLTRRPILYHKTH